MKIREMNDYDLMHAIIDSGRAVVAAFVERGTDGAKPVEAELKSLAKDLGDGAIYSIVDVSENPTIAEKFGSGSMPSIALFREGKHIGTTTSLAHSELAEFVQRALKN